MSKLNSTFILCSLFMFILHTNNLITAQDDTLDSTESNCCREKIVKLHFYIQDAQGGPFQTMYEVARASITSTSPTNFGQALVIDNLMTAQPSRNSTIVGRAQGIITYSDLTVSALATNLNFYFTSGPYNGSTLCVLGRNQILNRNRELPIVGGTGVFRMARGYSISNIVSYDTVIGYGILEYNVTVATLVGY